MCDDHAILLNAWDAAFAACYKVDPSDEHCDQTQEAIDVALFKHREMDLSVTPMVHDMGGHDVEQMRRVPGGISKLVEYRVEQYLHFGYHYDGSWHGTKLIRQAEF